MTTRADEAHLFLTGGGETGALIRNYDWATSPLGPLDSWPQSLRTVVSLMLGSKFPMFVAWGRDLQFLYNDAYAEILAGKHPCALGARFRDVWPEIWSDIFPIVEKALQGQPSYHEGLELTVYRHGRDEQAWFTFSYSPARDESGEVVGMFSVVTETTAQVLAERHRIAEFDRMRRLFQQAPGLIAVVREPSHIFEIANDAYLQLVGHRDVIGKTVKEALPELASQGFLELLDKVFSTGEPYIGQEVPIKLQRKPAGPLEERFVSFVYQPILDYRGNITGIFVEGSDVTDSVRAHQAVRDNEERLRQLANTIPQLAWIADRKGSIEWYNDRWYEYTGATFEELQGAGWTIVQHPDSLPKVVAEWEACLQSGNQFEMSFPLRAANGEYRTFFTRASPLRNATGEIVQWFGTNTDVTPLEEAQKELAAASRRKDEFLAMLAHELRNPLAPIASAAELLKLCTVDEARVRSTSAVISRQVTHMKGLIDDLLDVSRVTRGLVTLEEQTLSVGSVLAEAIEQTRFLMETKRHHFSVVVPDEQFFVKGDQTRMTQVVSNLLNNAAKYTLPEGRIILRVAGDGTQVKVSVEDSGVGIEASLQPHIFDLFTQAERTPDRAQGGLGIGLALVKNLVELQRGSVSMHSKGEGKGSVFTLTLPLCHATQPKIELTDTTTRIDAIGDATQVLVVDDNHDAADMLSLLLQSLGHTVTVSYNSYNALALAQQLAPTILFLDIGIPDMDGYELARKMRAMPQTKDSLLVAVTGYGQLQDKERCIEAGFNHHLVKPVTFEQVVELLTAA